MKIAKVGIIGAGQMGSGIAQVCATAGYEVLLNDMTPERIAAGLDGIANNFARRIKAGKSTEEVKASALAKIEPPASFHILRHTYASLLAMRGVPMGVIAAQLGHADTRMTEKHYAHLSPSYVAQTIRANFPVLNLAEESQVVPLRMRVAT